MCNTIVETRILVGKRARNPLRKMYQEVKKWNYQDVRPWKFECRSCHTEWGGHTISVGTDLKQVSCSTCYGDNVVMTLIKVTVLEDKDLS